MSRLPRWFPPIVLLAWLAAGCGSESGTVHTARFFAATRPDEFPALVSGELPFRYPASLYARRVQGNVTLRLYIDRDGRVMADSTRIYSASGYPALDSAAVSGARDLHFVPAKLHGEPMAMSVLFPLFFRHPEAPPLPGDSMLTTENQRGG